MVLHRCGTTWRRRRSEAVDRRRWWQRRAASLRHAEPRQPPGAREELASIRPDGYARRRARLSSVLSLASGEHWLLDPGSGGLGKVTAGQNPSFRADATKLVALTTDAPMHEPATIRKCFDPSPPCPMGYPGPSLADTVAALNAAGTTVIALKSPGATPRRTTWRPPAARSRRPARPPWSATRARASPAREEVGPGLVHARRVIERRSTMDCA
jgi:hypothetical protein